MVNIRSFAGGPMRPPRVLLVPPLLAAIIACSALQLPAVGGDPGAARAQLRAVAESGPVPLVAVGIPQGIRPEMVADALARGIRGLAVGFEAADRVRPGSVVASFVEVAPESLCRGDAARPKVPAEAGSVVLLVWCGDRGAVASVGPVPTSGAPAEVERTLWRVASRLFPDDYADRYGIDLFGLRIGIGASVGFRRRQWRGEKGVRVPPPGFGTGRYSTP
jgi:hypothetical protein